MDMSNNKNNKTYQFITKKSDINPSILTLKQIKERIKPIIEKYNIKEVYLFGSYARGEANRNSDVDIYCSHGDVNNLLWWSWFNKRTRRCFRKKVDVVTIGSKIHPIFKEQLDKDKIKIYEKQ